MINQKKIAIIGSGIAGLSAAYFLRDHNITLYEKNNRLGGHSRTIRVYDDKSNFTDVDTGFIVFNDRTYPNLCKLFNKLSIEVEKTEMSFAISVNDGELEWAGSSINTLFAQRKNLFNKSMLKGVYDILKFNNNAQSYSSKNPELTLGQLINKMKLGDWFKNYYILPMGAAIWSCSYEKIMNFPASIFINFFSNHGLLNIMDRPQWFTLKNKSIDYVNALEKLIGHKGSIIKKANIQSILRTNYGVEIKSNDETQIFDEVIFACHPECILEIFKDVSEVEKGVLAKFKRQKNIAITHSDSAYMPKIIRCWSSWNYLYNDSVGNKNVSVTYWMNKLQHIRPSIEVYLTLNPIKPIDEDKIYDEIEFYHPVFDFNSQQGQEQMDEIQGLNKIWFCGAYLRYGFHEDGIWSSLNVIEKMGLKAVW